MKRIIFAFAFFLYLVDSQAQISQETFESFKLQERREIQYSIPEDYSEENKYPIIIVLDAEYLFDNVAATAKFYSKFHGMPKAIVVGINQLKKDFRYADCAFDENSGLPDEKAKQFFEFIGLELIPHIESKYNTAPFKMIFGYDISANFINYYLFKGESLFNSYVSISPTLATEMETRVPARLGAMEKTIFYNLITDGEILKKSTQLPILNTAIKSIESENVKYFYTEYKEADHTSVATYGIGKAFDNVFKMFKPISPAEYKTQILTSEGPVFDYLSTKYDMIEKLFGFRKNIDLNDIMAIYAASRKKEDFESLKPLSDICKKQYPETMLGFYFEGEYFEQMGEPKKALRTFEKAFGMQEIDFLTKDMALEKIDALKADFGF